MVAQQKIKDSSSECSDSGSKTNPGSPKSRLAMLKRSSAKAKANVETNDVFRFQGNGVDFKGKLIGERDVNEPRGDEMCAQAMALAKSTIKSTGKHKPRIVLNISIDGLKIKDEKSGAVLYNFPVSKISFIARDTTDARAFGFIFGTQEGKYKFYGIKTAQTADHAVLSIRDMFQVVFEMKKKQIEEVKQKKEEQENKEREENGCRMEGGVAVADLLDLESELQNIEQGFNQLQNIPSMPEDSWPTQNGPATVFHAAPFGGSSPAANDPFGDSFTSPSQLVPSIPPPGQIAWTGFAAVPPPPNGFVPQAVPNGAFAATNPFVQTPQATQPAVDPFNTESAHRVISAITTTHSYALPVTTKPTVGADINWGLAKENTAPKTAYSGILFDYNANSGSQSEQKRVTTLEEAFSKLVDMDALVATSNAVPETKKNPFEHIINPPKLPLNALSSSTVTAPLPIPNRVPVVNNQQQQKQQQFVLPTARNDPFNDDFFN
jgi:hypothetical protein